MLDDAFFQVFHPLPRKKSAYSSKMDTLDRKIISHLRDNARANYQNIGHDIGLSPSAVKRRVDKLRQDGTIRRFTVDVDPAVDGLGVSAYVELHCRGTVSPHELKRLLDSVPEVVGAGTVSGEADAIVHMRATDIQALEEAIERVRLAPNVEFTKSSIVLSELIDRD